MKYLFTCLLFIVACTSAVYAQDNKPLGVGIAHPDPRALLHLESTDKALFLPRLTTSQRNAQTAWKAGMIIYNTTDSCVQKFNGLTWRCLGDLTALELDTMVWKLRGNSGTDTVVNFIGTTDNKSLMFRINNTNAGILALGNTSLGYNSFPRISTGYDNTAFGAGTLAAGGNNFDNTAIGHLALNKAIGSANTAIGSLALLNSTSGRWNNAIGYLALLNNITGDRNNALGSGALNANTTGSDNTAIGFNTLTSNTTGSYNTALGNYAGNTVTAGHNNIVIGSAAVPINTSAAAASYEMNIGNTLFGINVDSTVGIGSIGINTRTPSVSFHVNGRARVDSLPSGTITDSIVTADGNGNLHKRTLDNIMANNWRITGNNATTASNFLGTTDNVSLRIRTNNAQRMLVDSLGYVGIGVAAPQTRLQVDSSVLFGLDTAGTGNKFYWNALTGSLAAGSQDTAYATNSMVLGFRNKVANSSYGGILGYLSQITAAGPANYAFGDHHIISGNASTTANIAVGSSDTISAGAFNLALGYRNNISGTGSNGNYGLGYNHSVYNAAGTAVVIGSTDTVNAGTNNVAIGFRNNISGTGANGNYGLGYNHTVSGSANTATAIGSTNLISGGTDNIAIGLKNKVSGTGTNGNYALGYNHIISGTTGTAVVIGSTDTVAAGTNNVAIGFKNNISGTGVNGNYGLGYNHIINGATNTATAIGNSNNILAGTDHTVLGSRNTISATATNGNYILGYNNRITGAASTVVNSLIGGSNTMTASNIGANYALGNNNTLAMTAGIGIALGRSNNISGGQEAISLGSFNTITTTSGGSWPAIAIGSFIDISHIGTIVMKGGMGGSVSERNMTFSAFMDSGYVFHTGINGMNVALDIDADANASFFGGVTMNGTSGLTGNGLDVINSASVGGQLTVTGSIDLGGDLTAQGNITTNGTFFGDGSGITSDQRLKKNIVTLSPVLNSFKQLRGVTYYWNDTAMLRRMPGQQIGMIAQELEGVYPQLVMTNQKTGYKTVNYAQFTGVLLQGIKEQQAQIDAQQEQIDLLKKEIEAIKARLH